MNNFWVKLKKPFFALAPMHEITDVAFREIVCEIGKPDVLFTEFVSADGLCSKGKEKLSHSLLFSEKERPIAAQIFSSSPEKIGKAVEMAEELGFDGVDLNMGCPDGTIIKQGSCAALMKNHNLAKEIILAAKSARKSIPISVKTRLGYSKTSEFERWFQNILEAAPEAITIHARTKAEMYKPITHWEYVAKGAEMASGSGIIIVGNGEVKSIEEARSKQKESSCDGIMIGRAALSNPWIFAGRNPEDISKEERIETLLKHVKLYEKYFSGRKSLVGMKKFYRSYINHFGRAKEIRMELTEGKNFKDIKNILDKFIFEN